MTATFGSPRRPRHTETSNGSTVTSPRDHRGNRAASPCVEGVWRRPIPQRVRKNVLSGQRQTRSGGEINLLPDWYKHRILINAQSQQDWHNVCVIITQAQLKSEQNSASISPPAVWFLSARARLFPHPLVGCARSPDALRLRAYATFGVIHRTGVQESRRRNRLRKTGVSILRLFSKKYINQ